MTPQQQPHPNEATVPPTVPDDRTQVLLEEAHQAGRDCWCLRNRAITADAARPGEQWWPTVVLCASHTPGVWKIQGKLTHQGRGYTTYPLMMGEDLTALRAALACRGFRLKVGRLCVGQFTGLEVYERDPASPLLAAAHLAEGGPH